MEISIAMATYNGARYLEQQLESFAHQSLLPDELVVSDDGSSDATLEILEHFAKQAPFLVRVFRNRVKLGFTQNFARAVALAEGDTIFLSDQDDVWFPEKLDTVTAALQASPSCVMAIHDLEIADATLNRTGLTLLGQNRSLGLTDEYFNPGCCMALRAGIKPLILPVPPEAITHDIWINSVVLALGSRCVIEAPLQLYRRHGNNATNWTGSRLSRVNWLHQFEINHAATRPDYSRMRCALGIIEQRLARMGRTGYAQLRAYRSFEDVVGGIERERRALGARDMLMASNRMRRKLLATRMWLKGDYRYFRGWKSFAKDMLR